MDEVIPVALAALVGAALASATGFGFALVLAPVAFAVLDAEAAIWTVTLLGLVVNGMTLGAERRRPRPLGAEVAGLLAWSAPGAVGGALALQALSETALQVLVSVVVLASLAVRRVRPGRGPAPAWARPAAGVSLGALNASVGSGGPPVVLYLLRVGAPSERMRDTLTAVFFAVNLLTAPVLLATGVTGFPDGAVLAAGTASAVLGQLAGRVAFRRLAHGGYEAVLVATLAATALGGVLRALG